MITFLESSLSIQNSPVSTGYLSNATLKYAKIAGVALVIIGTITTLYYIYRYYEAKAWSDDDSDIPSHISPKHRHLPDDSQQLTEHSPDPSHSKIIIPEPPPLIDMDKKAKDKKKNTMDHDDSINDDLKKKEKKPDDTTEKSKTTTEEEDLEFAKKLQEQLLAEDLDYSMWEESDDVLAKQWQANADKKDLHHSPKITPLPENSNSGSKSAIIEKPQQVVVATPKEKPKPTKPNPFVQIESICGKIAENVFIDPFFSTVKTFSVVNSKTTQQTLELLNEIIAEYERRYYPPKIIKYEQQVPAYFANVKEEPIEVRKYLSLVGIRNLIKCGPGVIDDFTRQRFLGGEHHYGWNQGLRTFKYYTGNVVDLDIEIDAINDAEAIKIAEQKIVQFGEICGLKKHGGGKLTAADVAKLLPYRHLDLPKNGIVHPSPDNVDRSNYGVWKRVNPSGKALNYYINVPNCDLVLMATLRLPYIIAELAYLTKEHNKGTLPKEFFDRFFEKGLSEKCFNEKAQTFMEFYHDWKAKIEEVPSAEEDARQKIEKGIFGEALKAKGAELVFKEAYNRAKLTQLTSDCDHEIKGRHFDQWLKEEEEGVIEFLKSKGLWEMVLYQTEAGKDFFLLNRSTLKLFLKDYFEGYLQYM